MRAMNEQYEVLGLVLWAMALGGVIGIERERNDKPAGLRTHILVAGAAALVTSVGASLVTQAGGVGDASRGLHAVITGIGFLGAGAILRPRKGPVGGLTTAATVFYTAAVGGAVAAGFGVSATGATVLGILALDVVGRHVAPKLQGTGPDLAEPDF